MSEGNRATAEHLWCPEKKPVKGDIQIKMTPGEYQVCHQPYHECQDDHGWCSAEQIGSTKASWEVEKEDATSYKVPLLYTEHLSIPGSKERPAQRPEPASAGCLVV